MCIARVKGSAQVYNIMRLGIRGAAIRSCDFFSVGHRDGENSGPRVCVYRVGIYIYKYNYIRI